MNALEIRGLTKHYKGFHLEPLDLTVPGGTILGLIGENGAGKSTTIKCILNLIRSDGGSIQIFGRDAGKDSPALREDVGIALDEAMFHEVLKVPAIEKILAKLYKNWDHALFEDYLRKFDLPRDKKLKEFSRGMKMKLCIAAALSHHPRLLILDEATGGLDPVVRGEILDEFSSFIQDEEHAILISSHITSDLEKIADYVTYLHKGRVAVSGTKDEILDAHGRLVCSRSDLERVDPALLAGVRISQFSCEALVKNRAAFRRKYPDLTVDGVTLEDIMVFTVKGDGQ